MTLAINIQLPPPKIHRQTTVKVAGNLIYPPTPAKIRRLPPRLFTITSVQSSENVESISSDPSLSSQFTTSVASPSIQVTLTQRHFTVLNIAACMVAISATWLFCSSIPTLLAFKRAAESLEKLLDVTREELPDTMAAVRLSGMEISDLTTEISDLGQGLTQGVKRSTNVVRVAEEKLRDFANLTSKASIQEVLNTQATKAETAVARTARGIREGIVKSRAVLNMVFVLSSFSTLVVNYISNRSRKQPLKNY